MDEAASLVAVEGFLVEARGLTLPRPSWVFLARPQQLARSCATR
jgi:hypothetical protein